MPTLIVEEGVSADDGLQALLLTSIIGLMTLRTRRGVLVEDLGQPHLADLRSR